MNERVGRIQREAFVLHIGDKDVDVDELRSYFPYEKIRPLIEALDPPLTALEMLHFLNVLDFANCAGAVQRTTFLRGLAQTLTEQNAIYPEPHIIVTGGYEMFSV